TLPAVTPAGSKSVKVTLSATEMNADNVTVILSDASGDEWCDLIVNIQTIKSGHQFDDMLGNDADTVINGKQINISNSSGNAVNFTSTGGNGRGLNLEGSGSGAGLRAVGGSTGDGVLAMGGSGGGHGINANGSTGTGDGIHADGGGGGGD